MVAGAEDTNDEQDPRVRRYGGRSVLAVAVGINLLPGGGSGTGGPQPSVSPTVAPTASPQPSAAALPRSGTIEAGTYLMRNGTSSFRVTFPAGWDIVVEDGSDIRKHRDQPGEIVFTVYSPDINVYPDACANEDKPPRTGPTADDLIAALRAQQNSDVSEPVAITVGGLPWDRASRSPPRRDWTSPVVLKASCGSGPGMRAATTSHSAHRPERTPVSIVETPSGRIVLSTGGR